MSWYFAVEARREASIDATFGEPAVSGPWTCAGSADGPRLVGVVEEALRREHPTSDIARAAVASPRNPHVRRNAATRFSSVIILPSVRENVTGFTRRRRNPPNTP
jgi:hypothetical protein